MFRQAIDILLCFWHCDMKAFGIEGLLGYGRLWKTRGIRSVGPTATVMNNKNVLSNVFIKSVLSNGFENTQKYSNSGQKSG